MRLSSLLQRKVIEARTGSVSSRFILGKRRYILFFNDIILDFVRECEKNGYKEELTLICRDWASVFLGQMLGRIIPLFPKGIVCNRLYKNIMKSNGYLDDFRYEKNGEVVTLTAKNEKTTLRLGENSLSTGYYWGLLRVLFGREVSLLGVEGRENGVFVYRFRIGKTRIEIPSKGRPEYARLNAVPEVGGESVTKLIKSGIFRMKGNDIHFRGKKLNSVENTIFHLLGQGNLPLHLVRGISEGYFRGIVLAASTREEKLRLLKTLLQAMGWGIVSIHAEENRISVEIKHPPYGFQKAGDNWKFLSRLVEGYMAAIDSRLALENVSPGRRAVIFRYRKTRAPRQPRNG